MTEAQETIIGLRDLNRFRITPEQDRFICNRIKFLLSKVNEEISDERDHRDEIRHDGEFESLVGQKSTCCYRDIYNLLTTFYNLCDVVSPREQNEIVDFGVGVVVEYDDGYQDTFMVVDYIDDSKTQQLSLSSPAGRAILGATKGESRTYFNGAQNTIRILEIFSPSTQAAHYHSSE